MVGHEPVVLTGPNGAGKTNILEALSFLIPGRGLRGAKLSEVARRDADEPADTARPWAVAAVVAGPAGDMEIGTGVTHDTEGEGGRDRRAVRVDGEAQRGQAALSDYFSAQWLTPQMDRLFLEGPSGRRRFLDRMVFGRDSAHAGRINGYDHAMRERARLLAQGVRNDGWLDALENNMAEKGVAIAAARLDMAGRLAHQLDQAGDGAFPQADLAVEGETEAWLADGSALAAEDKLRRAYFDNRRQDADAGRTARGPHRTDLYIAHRGRGRPAADCSTGEQKALLISLVLAQARLQAGEQGRTPVLLLDEVAAHLDETRRTALFDEIRSIGLQAWMTGTDRRLFDGLECGARFLHVDAAAVKDADLS